MRQHYYQEVPGWFGAAELYRAAVADAADGATLVEVGCWKGQGLAFLLVEAANSGKRLNVVGIDHFRGSSGEPYQTDEARHTSIQAQCRANCERAGYPFTLLALPSLEAAALFPDLSLDFVFLDAAHDYASVRDDCRAWAPKVKWGSLLAGDDYTGGFPGVEHGVRDFVPLGELGQDGQAWHWRKQLPPRGHWLRQAPRGAEWLLYLPYVNRPDLLAGALASVREHAERVVVIDQSEGGEAAGLHRGPLFRWTSPRRFTCAMNWIQRDADWRGLGKYAFLHSDAEAAPGGLRMLLAEAERLGRAAVKWGAIFTQYDALCLVNAAAVRDVGCWDESFGWYVSDIDYYNRLRWRGWEQQSLPEACAVHHVSQTQPGLPAEERAAVDRDHSWSIAHYAHKWGCSWQCGQGRAWLAPYNV